MPRYYVIVAFDSEEELERPQDYVESAVAEMRGCKSPDDPEFSIDPDSVKTIDVSEAAVSNPLSRYTDQLS